MIQPGDHIAEQTLSAFIDDQLAPEEASQAKTHLEGCSACAARVDELRSLVGLLHGLPSLEPPRQFSIGPRLLADAPNVVRLRRWYGVVRVGAATLAAAFVFLSAGALYVGSQSVPSSAGLSSLPQVAAAPAGSPIASPAARAAGAVAPAQSGAASTAAGAGAPPLGPAAEAIRARPAPGEDVTDQVTAATSVRPLPTPAPTLVPPPTPTSPRVVAASPPLAAQSTDAAAPLRTAAASVGLLAMLGVLAALVVRRRLRAASRTPTE